MRRVPGIMSGSVALSVVFRLAAGLLLNSGASLQSQSVSPQLIPRTHQEREERYKTQHTIVLSVEVTDASGDPVTGLQSTDFHLLQDRQDHPFASFRAISDDSVPAREIVLLLDTVNGSSRDIANDRKSIETFLRRTQGSFEFPTTFGIFTEAGIETGTPSRDPAFVLGQFRESSSGLQPIACANEVGVNDAFLSVWMPGDSNIDAESARQLHCLNRRFLVSVTSLENFATDRTAGLARTILVWVGPGWPLLYNKQFRTDDLSMRDNFYHHLVDVSRLLTEAQVTLDFVVPSDLMRKPQRLNDHDTRYLDGLPSEEEVAASSLGLQALAHQSGGQVLTTKDFPAAVAACIDDAKSYYDLTFVTPPATDFGQFHSLVVTVDKPQVSVRTRTVYYAEQ